uniref:Uncharacterized protein n=1 Tax=Sphaerodactylus townsendi TaxID=933632 RepID=A0ACB8F046_9SAUR
MQGKKPLRINICILLCKEVTGYCDTDVDVLQRLGLVGPRPLGAGPSSRSVPQGVIPFKSGVIFTQRARIEVPVGRIIPATFGTDLALVLSLCSHRVNNAFLFTIKNRKKKLQLGVQFIPGKIIVYVGHKHSIYFDYSVHDGQWHNLAIDIRGQVVTLFTSCGKQRAHADLPLKKDEVLDPEGSFLLGKLNQHSVQFEGALCQFDIYPSAKAAHNYCKYLKKQCRQADTYRSILPPLVPLLPKDLTASERTPPQSDLFLLGLKNLTTVIPPLSLLKVTTPQRNSRLVAASTPVVPSKPPASASTTKAAKSIVASTPVLPNTDVQLPAQTLHQTTTVGLQAFAVARWTTTVALVAPRSTSSASLEQPRLPATKNVPSAFPSSIPSSTAVINKKELEKKTKKVINQSQTIKPFQITSPAKAAMKKPASTSRSLLPATVKHKLENATKDPIPKKLLSLPALRKTDSTIIAVPYIKPTLGAYPVIRTNVQSINLTTLAATDGYQLFDPIGPTLFPFVVGLPGPKGDRGPPVSQCFLHDFSSKDGYGNCVATSTWAISIFQTGIM